MRVSTLGLQRESRPVRRSAGEMESACLLELPLESRMKANCETSSISSRLKRVAAEGARHARMVHGTDAREYSMAAASHARRNLGYGPRRSRVIRAQVSRERARGPLPAPT